VRTVYRFVHAASTDDPELVEDFRSDRDSGKSPFRREKAFPELRDGMSTFGSLEAARALWQTVFVAATARGQEVRMGNYIAEVELGPDEGFSLEDLDEPDEHLTIWGEPARLAAAVGRIYSATTSEE